MKKTIAERAASKALREVEKLGPTGYGVLTNQQLNRFYGEVFRGTERIKKKAHKK